MEDIHIPLYAEALSDGIGIIAASGTLRAANSALAHLLGYETKEQFLTVIGESTIFRSPSDISAFDLCMHGGPDIAGRRCILRTLRGEERIVAVTATRRADGMLDACFIPDHSNAVMENARLRSVLRRTHDHMAQTERTKTVGQLSGLFTHELNNVFGSVIGRAQLMQMRTTDERVLRECSFIVQAAEQGVGEVKRLLQFIYTSRQQSFGPMAVENVFDEACALLEPTFELCRQQRIPVTIAKNFEFHSKIFGYVADVREIIVHVLQNAFDALPNGGVITATCVYRNDDLVLTIADTGSGIAGDVQSKMFEPMFTTRAERRAGMGLTVVKELLRKMKGSISVKTDTGRGTAFAITIPKNDVSPADPVRSAQPRKNDAEAKFISKILLIDDDEGVLVSLDKLLSSKGFVTKAMVNSSDAARAAESFQPDIVITDLAMPEMNGWEIAKQIRKICPASKIILTTAFIDVLTEVEMKQATIDAVMQKPVNIEELLTCIMSG